MTTETTVLPLANLSSACVEEGHAAFPAPSEPGPGKYLIVANFAEGPFRCAASRNLLSFTFIVQGESLRHAEDVAEQALLDGAFLAKHLEHGHPIRRHAEAVASANDSAYLEDSNHPLRQRRCWAIDTVLPLHVQPVYQPTQQPPVGARPVPHLPTHTLGPGCKEEECGYHHSRHNGNAVRCYLTSGCQGVLHVAKADWGDYDYHGGGGRVYVDLCCDTCCAEKTGLAE